MSHSLVGSSERVCFGWYFQMYWGSSGLSTCNIACERFLMHRCDYLLITPIYVVIMCRISMQTRGWGWGVVVP